MARRVLIERTKGGPHPNFPVGTVREGWELSPPMEGDFYVLFTDTGSVFRTSRITRITNGTFQTRNSVYRFLVLEDDSKEPNSITKEIAPESIKALSG